MDSKILLSLFAVLCLGSVLGKPSGENNSRFVGGDVADEKNYGYMVGITTQEKCDKYKVLPECLGTLIGKQHVITAASCVNEFNKELKICVWNAGGETVEKIYVNEHYRVDNDQNIAVLKLEKPAETNGIEFYGDKAVAAETKCNIIGLAKEPIKTTTTTEKTNKDGEDPPSSTTTPPTDEYIFKVMELTPSDCLDKDKTANRTCFKNAEISASSTDIGAPLICDGNYAGILIKAYESKNTQLVYLKTKNLEKWINEKVSSACTSTISLTLIVASIAATLFGRQ